jgi:hypothetical protein
MPFDQDPNRMLSTDEAAGLMGLRPCTLSAWREDGSQPDLAFFKIGKAVRYRYGDVIAFLNARRAMSTLAAREMKLLAQHPKKDNRAPPVDHFGPGRPRRKKPASDEGGVDAQQSLF